jgi:hypothetical protein
MGYGAYAAGYSDSNSDEAMIDRRDTRAIDEIRPPKTLCD